MGGDDDGDMDEGEPWEPDPWRDEEGVSCTFLIFSHLFSFSWRF